MLAENTLLGGYRIKKAIGQGGMGEVYRAHDPKFKREVALKLLSQQQFWLEPEKYKEALERFRREARIIASLQHYAIVPVIDFGEDQGYPFIVMRLMKGGSLADALKNGPLQLDEIVRILSWLAPALDKVHRKGVIHRDLKPSNILFDEDKAPYIADFGIAKLIEANTKLTDSGAKIGTGYYMSPEQARGDKNIDGRSDLYSLGATLFEMLTGKPPYHRAHPAYAPYLHINEPPPQLNELCPDLSNDFQAIIDRAMAKKPEERYTSAHELAEAVKGLVEKSPQSAKASKVELSVVSSLPASTSTQNTVSMPPPVTPSGVSSFSPITPLIKRLTPWNPLDHLRLLWWTLVTPKQLKAYREQFGEEAERPTSKWLVSTLLWLPVFLPLLVVGLGIIPFSPFSISNLEITFTANHYLSTSGGLFIAWLLTGAFGDKDENEGTVTAVLLGGVPGVLAGVLAGILAGVLGKGLMGILSVELAILLAVCVPTVLVLELWIGLAGVIGAALGIGLKIGFLLAHLLELLSYYYVSGVKGIFIVMIILLLLFI